MEIYVQNRPSSHTCILHNPPVLPAQNQRENDGIQEVCERSVQRPQSLEAARMLSMRIQPGRRLGELP